MEIKVTILGRGPDEAMNVKRKINSKWMVAAAVSFGYAMSLAPFSASAGDGDITIDIIIGAPKYESRRHVHRERLAGRERYKDGKSEYKYDDGVVKIEEKIDRRADKYEYKYEGPDGKCEEKYDQGKYEYKCD